MKTLLPALSAGLALALHSTVAAPVILSLDTVIADTDFAYDGADLVVSNCTVAIDGRHVFSSLAVRAGGRLTHSVVSSGELRPGYVFGGLVPLTLTGTNSAAFADQDALAESVVVRDQANALTYTNELDYILEWTSTNTLAIRRTETSTIPDGSGVSISYSGLVPPLLAGMHLRIDGSLFVDGGSAIDVSGCGYGPAGPLGRGGSSSASSAGGGGGHAGYGGMGSGNAGGGAAHGQLSMPEDLGGAGGAGVGRPGAYGGGRIRISVADTARIDGFVRANGNNATNSRAGGGAGGSIWITANHLTGSGVISAHGGNGEPIHGGGGGGGRIAVEAASTSFLGRFGAAGGNGWQAGGAGTIYTRFNPGPGMAWVNNEGRAGTNTPIQITDNANLLIEGRAIAVPAGAQRLETLIIGENGQLAAPPGQLMEITVAKDVVIHSSAAINASRRGLAARLGLGAGGTLFGSGNRAVGGGAGHGGYGMHGTNVSLGGQTAFGGNAHGSAFGPASVGSGGGGMFGSTNSGGVGGGAIRLNAHGTVEVRGEISADAGDAVAPGGGGGSGGSVWITAARLTGGGRISADGGNGWEGGGGGGGRVALYLGTNQFSGAIQAYGGSGPATNWGGAGTIYVQTNGAPAASFLLVDNGSRTGTNTPIPSLKAVPNVTLQISGAGRGEITVANELRHLLVKSNSALGFWSTGHAFPMIAVLGNALIESGAEFRADGASAATVGATTSASNGGTHAGFGGLGTNGGASYLSPIGTVTSPVSAGGSGSPSFLQTGAQGGRGGGAIRMDVRGTLQLHGAISANGATGSGGPSGGGAGGSIWITAGAIEGSGSASASGARGIGGGGGGGGGRIAIASASNTFTGVIRAAGGPGFQNGGPGTIYLAKSAQDSIVRVDNEGLSSTNTVLSLQSTNHLQLTNGAAVFLPSYGILQSIDIAPQALLIVSPGMLTVGSNVLIRAGGVLSVARDSSTSSPGSGGTSGTGGGHGGAGGAGSGVGSPSGGGTHDLTTAPRSAGGSGFLGGRGGGALQLSVDGDLVIDGELQSDGDDGRVLSGTGSLQSGGGAGGSLYLSAGRVSGSGSISANGGDGVNGGGGGGGGRIALYFATNLFGGRMTAFGGSGFRSGGAGTVYMKQTNKPGLLIVDNSGAQGADTSFSVTMSDDVTLRGGAAARSPFSARTLQIESNAVIRFSTSFVSDSGITASNVFIAPGGGIIGDGAGSGQTYPGGGIQYGTGGGHGGYGGGGAEGTAGGGSHGSHSQPADSGSPGAPGSTTSYSGGRGGGALRMTVSGLLRVDGLITANGTQGFVAGGYGTIALGGGSGGSLWINAGQLAGSGWIAANGGEGLNGGGGGGGGRIAINTRSNHFGGIVEARGGAGFRGGGAGTVYLKNPMQAAGALIVDNRGVDGTNTPIQAYRDDLIIRNGGKVSPGSTLTLGNLRVETNGWLVPSGTPISALNAVVLPGGRVLADGVSRTSSGGGGSSAPVPGGGSHGGLGGGNTSSSRVYGQVHLPAPGSSGSPGGGSAGAGGAGGGGVDLSVSGTLSVDGRISADGAHGLASGGGGSGGGLRISAGTISGSGEFFARGGDGGFGTTGGGGGGRIALTFRTNLFAGRISARGGAGAFNGGAGTVFFRNLTASESLVIVDNDGMQGTNTPVGSTVGFSTANLLIGDGAVVHPLGTLSPSNLTITAGGTLTTAAALTNLDLLVLGALRVEEGGLVSVSGAGYAAADGPGAGSTSGFQGSGGGHGGRGGDSARGVPGGVTYGSARHPATAGSGGGRGFLHTTGSEGGGVIQLSVLGTMRVDGKISADGNWGISDDAGGGAGGSVWIMTSALTGDGAISADGGFGELFGGGGGGGGRVAIFAKTNRFGGMTSARGGLGAFNGEDGTVIATNLEPFAVITHSPAGIVREGLRSIEFSFNQPLHPSAASLSHYSLITPHGMLSGPGLSLDTTADRRRVTIAVPVQFELGQYEMIVSSNVQNFAGDFLPQPYSAALAIQMPVLSGAVTDLAGNPVPGITIRGQREVDWSATTATDGTYALPVPDGWSGSITPSSAAASLFFSPTWYFYSNLAESRSGQDFIVASSPAADVRASADGNQFKLRWIAFFGVVYQAYASTNLVDWTALGDPVVGGGDPVSVALPRGSNPNQYFRIDATW